MLRPENIERQEEKERDSVGTKLNLHLVIEIHPIKGIGDKCRVNVIVLYLSNQIQRLAYRANSKE